MRNSDTKKSLINCYTQSQSVSHKLSDALTCLFVTHFLDLACSFARSYTTHCSCCVQHYTYKHTHSEHSFCTRLCTTSWIFRLSRRVSLLAPRRRQEAKKSRIKEQGQKKERRRERRRKAQPFSVSLFPSSLLSPSRSLLSSALLPTSRQQTDSKR